MRHFLYEDASEEQVSAILGRLSEGLSGADIKTIALAARRHAVITERPVDPGIVAYPIIHRGCGVYP